MLESETLKLPAQLWYKSTYSKWVALTNQPMKKSVASISDQREYNFSSGPFWTHKIKTKVKYISFSNILHLLSTTGPVPHAVPILPSLVVESKHFISFSVLSNFEFDCCFVSVCIQRQNKEPESFIVEHWTEFCDDHTDAVMP